MAIESMVALGLATFILLLISIYANKHRSEDHHDKKKNQNGADTPD
jgi:hypothetical protein